MQSPRSRHSRSPARAARVRVSGWVCVALAACVAWPATVAATSARPRPFTLDDLSRLARLSEPEISPDGGSVVVVVARANLDTNGWDAELLLVDTASAEQTVLVRNRPGVGTPRFSPSGDRLAFLAAGAAPAAGAAASVQQVFVMSMAGGEAIQVTKHPRDVETFAWSRDGGSLAFVAAAPATTSPPAGPERFNDSFELGSDGFLVSAPPVATHLWLVDAAGGEARRLSTAPGSLSAGFGPSTVSWSADGRSIAVARAATASSGDADQSRIEVIDTASGTVRRLTGRDAFESAPAFAPDGSSIAFSYPRGGDPASVSEVRAGPAAGGPEVIVTGALDRSILSHRWLPDSRSLLVTASDGTRSGLWLQPLDGTARRVELGPIAAVSELAVATSGAIALVGSEMLRPPELYLLDSATALPRRLTDLHTEIAARELARSEPLEWESEDGFRSDGVLTFPPAFDPSRRWPLVLYLHGGPTASSNEAFDELAQLLAARGWLVLQPNYRGSDNRGEAHQRGIVAGAGSGPGRDVWAGLQAVRARGYVDDERVAVSGWSYGGFMTVWMLGHYPGWRAAVAGAAALDLYDMYSLSDLNVMRRHAITGSPWTGGRAELYRRESPLSSVTAIRAPTLILSNTQDARVAVTQSFRLFRALRDLGVETRFFAYPVPGHFPTDPVRRSDVYRRWVGWIADHFSRAESPAPPHAEPPDALPGAVRPAPGR